MSHEFCFGPANFYFWQPRWIVSDKVLIKIHLLSKKMEKCMFGKPLFFFKLFLWTRRMELQQTGQEKRRGQKLLLCLKMIKNFICFQNSFFFKKGFYRYGECNFDRPAKLLLLKYQKWSGKSQQKCKNFLKFFSSKRSNGEVESSLKAQLTFTDS